MTDEQARNYALARLDLEAECRCVAPGFCGPCLGCELNALRGEVRRWLRPTPPVGRPCPRKRSAMTPCYLERGVQCLAYGQAGEHAACVGCGLLRADLDDARSVPLT